jgi:hypothetical protein
MRSRLQRIVPCVAVLFALSACGGGSGTSSTAPTPVTKVIAISGNLSFGNVTIGQTVTQTFTISNSGNAALTFTAILAIGGSGTAGNTASPLSGVVQPASSVTITVAFTPTLPQTYTATLSVMSDATSGNSSIGFSGTGVN